MLLQAAHYRIWQDRYRTLRLILGALPLPCYRFAAHPRVTQTPPQSHSPLFRFPWEKPLKNSNSLADLFVLLLFALMAMETSLPIVKI